MSTHIDLYDFDVHGGSANTDHVAWKVRVRIGDEVVEGGLGVTIPRGRVELTDAIEKTIEEASLYSRMDADAHGNAVARDLAEDLLHAQLRDATQGYERTLDILRAEDFKNHPVGGIEVVATARMRALDAARGALLLILDHCADPHCGGNTLCGRCTVARFAIDNPEGKP